VLGLVGGETEAEGPKGRGWGSEGEGGLALPIAKPIARIGFALI
jgi:hypothetical protein